jgi:hypothetical protein
MSSKQINFFFSPDELCNVVKFLRKKDCIIVKGDYKNSGFLEEYDIVKNNEAIYQVFIFKHDDTKEASYNHVESTGVYYIDILISNCIEFSIGGFYPYSDKNLHSARLYYVFNYFDKSDKIIRKDQGFINWADDIFKSFKKEFLIRDVKYSKDFVTRGFGDYVEKNHAMRTPDGTKYVIG